MVQYLQFSILEFLLSWWKIFSSASGILGDAFYVQVKSQNTTDATAVAEQENQ